MTRATRKPDANLLDTVIPKLKGKAPTLDELMRRPEIPDYWKLLPPPTSPGNPFGPVPIIPRSPPGPTWPHGPPYLGEAPRRAPVIGEASYEYVSPQDTEGLMGMIRRAGIVVPPDRQGPTAGGLVELLQAYLGGHRGRAE